MTIYYIDFYENDEFVCGYRIEAHNKRDALIMAKQEMYLDGLPFEYYVIYNNNNFSEEGWC